MRISEERISHLAHLIWDGLYDDDLVDYPDEEKTLQTIKVAIQDYFKVDDDMDEKVREKIGSLSKKVNEGSPEWEILYKKYYEEEANRRSF